MNRKEIFKAIENERQRQETLHPEKLSDFGMLAVLVEEVGEVAESLQAPFQYENMKDEILQVASVCVRWLEARE